MIKTYLDTGKPEQCCGCGACSDACPCSAIVMKTGKDKSDYPVIIKDKCIDCKKCRKVCPMFSTLKSCDESYNGKAYAALLKNEDERVKSSSGGAFEGIAAALCKQYHDLYIAGAAWEKSDSGIKVVHKLLPASERTVFKKSKYVQSDCIGIYKSIYKMLEIGKPVLFTGTPCQVSALKSYLEGGKEYDNLFTLDIVCRGVPGAKVFDKFINELEKKYSQKVESVEFRYKKKDFFGEIHSDYLKIQLEHGKKFYENQRINSYLRGFKSGLFFRESCYSCPFAQVQRAGDFTIGDYWHIQKIYSDLIDYTGISCIIINSVKGEALIKATDLEIRQTDMSFLMKHNGKLHCPENFNKNRNIFFDNFDNVSFDKLIDLYAGKAKYLKNFVSSFIPGKVKRKLKRDR